MPRLPPACSYTPPKRLPKKRKRPTTAEFRKAAAELDYKNSLSTESKIPAIIDLLSDSDCEPEMRNNESTQYRLAQHTQAKDLKRETAQSRRAKAQKEKNMLKRRRLVVDSEDESDDDSASPSLSSSASTPSASKRNHRQDRRRRRGEEWILSDTEEEGLRTPVKKKLGLKAEIEDLEIDMKGWGDVATWDG